jgi:anti-sigma factor RsiW
VSRKSAHPEKLFEYLRGELDGPSSQVIDEHLSTCDDCRAIVALTGTLKHRSERAGAAVSLEPAEAHPDVSEIASFFYGKPVKSRQAATAAHVAACHRCAQELAEYASAERAAAEYNPSHSLSAGFPSAAWELIRDWEESSFAQQKSATYGVSQEMIARLTHLLAQRREDLLASSREAVTHPESGSRRAALVPVMIVDRSGSLRGVEMFERATDAMGADVLKYTGEPERFDRKPFHALLDFGDSNRVVVSDLILRDEIRLPRVERADCEPREADYFIVED